MKCTYANVQTSSVTVSGKQLFTRSATVRLGREGEKEGEIGQDRNLDVSDVIYDASRTSERNRSSRRYGSVQKH